MQTSGSPFEPSAESAVEAEAPSFGEALRHAAERLGIDPADLAVEILDPGRSAESSGGYRPVKIRARRRPPREERRYEGGGERGTRRPRETAARETPVYGPPPPPMDPSRITPEIVAMVRDLSTGLLASMRFDAKVDAAKSAHGVRVGIDAGERDQFLIGKDGDTLAAFQHLLGRMIRARMPDESPPRVEVDVAGFRDRHIEKLRELARELMDEVRETGEEVSTEPLAASERRIVHLEVAEVPGLETVTVGDGYYKRVVVRRGTAKRQDGGA